MTPQQEDLIRSSWTQVAPIADTAAVLFYDRLFELDPALRPMFAHTDMAAQRKVLMQTLTVVVRSIDKLDTLIPAIEALGSRHAGHGVRPGDYATVGRALLDTLRTGLGDEFTPDVEAAWTEAYTLLAGVMLAATSAEEQAA
jgi:hemoglobin-like flavoprotein